MKKKIIVGITVFAILIGCAFVGRYVIRKSKINSILNKLSKDDDVVLIVENGKISSDVDSYKDLYEISDDNLEIFKEYVIKVNKEMVNKVKDFDYSLKRPISEDNLLLGVLNQDDSLFIYYYENGDVLAFENDSYYSYHIDNVDDLKEFIDNYIEGYLEQDFVWFLQPKNQ